MKKLFINPNVFKIYKNNSIGFGGFIISRLQNMFVLKHVYINEVIQSSHLPWCIETKWYGDTVLKNYFKHNIMSYDPYEGLEIYISEENSQIIHVNGYKLKVAYCDSNQIHQLLKGGDEIKESKSLLELFEEAKK